MSFPRFYNLFLSAKKDELKEYSVIAGLYDLFSKASLPLEGLVLFSSEGKISLDEVKDLSGAMSNAAWAAIAVKDPLLFALSIRFSSTAANTYLNDIPLIYYALTQLTPEQFLLVGRLCILKGVSLQTSIESLGVKSSIYDRLASSPYRDHLAAMEKIMRTTLDGNRIYETLELLRERLLSIIRVEELNIIAICLDVPELYTFGVRLNLTELMVKGRAQAVLSQSFRDREISVVDVATFSLKYVNERSFLLALERGVVIQDFYSWAFSLRQRLLGDDLIPLRQSLNRLVEIATRFIPPNDLERAEIQRLSLTTG
jgi:hypothetical protein